MHYKKLYLKKNEERRIHAGHPWVYSNEVDTKRSPLKNFLPGEVIYFISSTEKVLAVGYVNPHTLISGRILSTDLTCTIDENFFISRISFAQSLRADLFQQPFYRLVYGESDGLPGLIIDRYDQVFVIQTNTAGMEVQKSSLVNAIKKLFPTKSIIFKNDSSIRHIENLENYVEVAYGEHISTTLVEENGLVFNIPILEGQKTGWFYDHRENRARLKKYVRDKVVLDVFSYVGGFGLQAASFGAKEVTCIDSSQKALVYAKENAKRNGYEEQLHYLQENAFDILKTLAHENKKFEVIILDPPALIKKRKDIDEGVIAYLRLNELAMNLLPEKGILVSCSCSLNMTLDKLMDVIRRAGIKTKKKVQILEIGFQGMDHPIHPAIIETAYLKAFFCLVRSP